MSPPELKKDDLSAPPPLVLSDPETADWDEAADVVVVGFGGAGVVASLQAREDGADVLAIDRFRGGGATAFSGGVIYSGGTRYQREAGFDDKPEEMFKYLRAEGTPLSDEALLAYCRGSNGDLEWLEGHGVPYGDNAYLGKTAFPPDGHWLYYSGNEMTPAFREKAVPAPRGHRVKIPGNGGPLYFARLREAALRKGVRLLPHTAAYRLIVDAGGRIVGVEVRAVPEAQWQEHDRLYAVINPWKPFNNRKAERAIQQCRLLEQKFAVTRCIRARAGVVLSTGGFIYNLDLLRSQRPHVAQSYEGLLRLGSMGCDGSGIALGRSAGGAVDLMDKLFLGSPLSPPISYLSGIIVNRDGARFINEDAYHARIGNAMAAQPGGVGWLILEGPCFRRAVKEALFPGKGMFMLWGAPALLNIMLGGTRRGRTLRGLARKCGIDPDGLEQMVQSFNGIVRQGQPDPLGKSTDKMHEIGRGPFYAVNLAISNRFMPTMAFTLGGLVVDENSGEVRQPDGSTLHGLYAAGRAAVGLCSNGYMSGLSIADTVFSGRRAGRSAALVAKEIHRVAA